MCDPSSRWRSQPGSSRASTEGRWLVVAFTSSLSWVKLSVARPRGGVLLHRPSPRISHPFSLASLLASTGGRVLGATRLSGSRLGRRGSTAALVRSASRDAERGSDGGYPAAPARGLDNERMPTLLLWVMEDQSHGVPHLHFVLGHTTALEKGVRTYVLPRAEVGGVCARARPHDDLRDGRTRTRELRGGAAA